MFRKKKSIDMWPQNGDVFYWVRSDTGDVCQGMWISSSTSCRFRQSIGNVFRSREDAKYAVSKQQAKRRDLEIAKL